VTTYPCVALLAFPGSRTKVVACVQGRFGAPQLLAALRRAAEEHGVLLTAERLQHEERVRAGRGRLINGVPAARGEAGWLMRRLLLGCWRAFRLGRQSAVDC
jgi:hypothetical protein